MTDRSNKVDVFRGLLFALMVNSHALTLASIPGDHWFYTDWWLPKGWATVVFVILSGYGVGLVYANRPPAKRSARLQQRFIQLISVMYVSNAAFAALREASNGRQALVLDWHWWLGFFTLDTNWTISGVLLPTALVTLCGATVIRYVERAPWLVLAVLVALRFLASFVTLNLAPPGDALGGLAWFLMRKGLGGYPVVPFLLNGCIGIWLGVMRSRRMEVWKMAMALLVLLQLGFYLAFQVDRTGYATQFLATLSPLGKFACLFVVTHMFERFGADLLVGAIERIGQFALGSFIMHRVFIQLLRVAVMACQPKGMPAEPRYVLLVAATLYLTWALCWLRLKVQVVDEPFRRLAL